MQILIKVSRFLYAQVWYRIIYTPQCINHAANTMHAYLLTGASRFARLVHFVRGLVAIKCKILHEGDHAHIRTMDRFISRHAPRKGQGQHPLDLQFPNHSM